MIKVSKKLKELHGYAELVLQIHDELVLEVDAALAEKALEIVVDAMEGVVDLSIPLSVDAGIRSSWGE